MSMMTLGRLGVGDINLSLWSVTLDSKNHTLDLPCPLPNIPVYATREKKCESLWIKVITK